MKYFETIFDTKLNLKPVDKEKEKIWLPFVKTQNLL